MPTGITIRDNSPRSDASQTRMYHDGLSTRTKTDIIAAILIAGSLMVIANPIGAVVCLSIGGSIAMARIFEKYFINGML